MLKSTKLPKEKRGWEYTSNKILYIYIFWLKPTAGYNFISDPKFFSYKIQRSWFSYVFLSAQFIHSYEYIRNFFQYGSLKCVCKWWKECLRILHCTCIFSCHALHSTTYMVSLLHYFMYLWDQFTCTMLNQSKNAYLISPPQYQSL